MSKIRRSLELWSSASPYILGIPKLLRFGCIASPFYSYFATVNMPSDAVDVQAGALTDLPTEHRVPVTEKVGHAVEHRAAYSDTDILVDGYPSPEELEGPSALRRISAPIPWAVYTVAFVELCERFSYYGTQVVCK
jgi:hypothetical protein